MITQKAFTLLLFGIMFAACASVQPQEEETGIDYHRQVAILQARLVENPNDEETIRDLGIAYFQLKQFPEANAQLKKAIDGDKNDAKAFFYYGMVLESQNNISAALATYINYSDFSSLSPYRKLMEGRYRALTEQIIQQQFQTLLANEQKLTGKKPSSSNMAVFPLTYQGTDERYAPLGKGLSEMISIDLARVKKLLLVERLRVEALLDELKLSKSKAVDASTAPRMGKLLSAGRLVTGSYNISNGQQLTIDVASWDAVEKQKPKVATGSDDYENLFRLEKEIVFSLIGKLGIVLTNEEREVIQQFPTRNLQAFLMYSIGLDKEDAHDFDAAGVYYDQAVALDPGFGLAIGKSEAMGAMSAAGESTEKALASANKADPPKELESPASNDDLMTKRLMNLGNGLGLGFFPGQDDRKGAQENAAGLGGILPEPLPPPSR